MPYLTSANIAQNEALAASANKQMQNVFGDRTPPESQTDAIARENLEEEIIHFCRDNLSSIKCPKTVDFEKELPRHPTGKLYKRLLKDRYWGKKDSKIV